METNGLIRLNSTRVAVALSAILALGCSAERNDDGEIIDGGAVDAFAVQVGDCYDDRTVDAGGITNVSGTPCSEAHDNEIFALFDVTVGEFPGDSAMLALADDGCLERFPDYVGASYEESVLAITHLVPSEESWREGDDREVVCAAYHMDLEKLEGSVRNSGM